MQLKNNEEKMLYPLKFKPILKDKIWGGQKLKTIFGRDFGNLPNAGESWDLSGVEGNESVVINGSLAGNNLSELLEVYMGDLVGDAVYERYGNQFPLLVKVIDANDALSIQVHPDDEMAAQRHNSLGKTEMWYLLDADEHASLISGFVSEMDKETYLKSVKDNTLESLLRSYDVQKGDVFFMPAGRVHAIGKGCLIAEIQETSDITYRIYDFNRVDSHGNHRELHTDLAVDAIDFSYVENAKIKYSLKTNEPSNVVDCEHFTTNVLPVEGVVERNYSLLDSFVILMGVEGDLELQWNGGVETLKMGETILIPAMIENITLKSQNKGKVLEVYIRNKK